VKRQVGKGRNLLVSGTKSVLHRTFIFLCLASLVEAVWLCDQKLQKYHHEITYKKGLQEVLYLPAKEALIPLSLKYQNVLGHYFWFSTVNYFGKHYRTDQDYRWLSHRCDLVTELNPKSYQVYQFCFLMLTWEQNAPERGVEILNKAIAVFPEKWELYYYRGFSHMFFLKDEIRARDDLLKAATLPGVHPSVVSLAAKKTFLTTGSTQEAKELLEGMLKGTVDPLTRDAIIDKIKKLES
jgi:hypothetical protein